MTCSGKPGDYARGGEKSSYRGRPSRGRLAAGPVTRAVIVGFILGIVEFALNLPSLLWSRHLGLLYCTLVRVCRLMLYSLEGLPVLIN